ncbi:MAG: hypothetical protein AAB554_02835 [Patescibacteria group bacterium]
MAREFRGGGETGRTFESRLFGTAQVNPQFLLDLDKIGLDERGRFRSVGQLYDSFKRNYLGAGHGERGETSMSTDLRVAVEDALGITDEGDELKFYSAVGSIIDLKLGVDAFFELTDPRTGAYARVTLDATLNKEKQKEGWKADVIIGEMPDAGQEADAYLDAIDQTGGGIANLLQRRLNDEIERRTRRRAS